MKLVLFIHLFLVVILAQQQCTNNPIKLDTSITPLKLGVMPWKSNKITNTIAAILLQEQLGIPTELVICYECNKGGNRNWLLLEELLVNNTFAGALEMWPSPVTKNYMLIYPFPLGVIGQIGWFAYVPPNYDCQASQCGINGWRDLRDSSIVSKFANNYTNEEGLIVEVPEGYGAFHTVRGIQASIDLQLVNNLGLKLVLIEHPTEYELTVYLLTLCHANIPFVHFLFAPHPFFFQMSIIKTYCTSRLFYSLFQWVCKGDNKL